jgi:hypothetical protein
VIIYVGIVKAANSNVLAAGNASVHPGTMKAANFNTPAARTVKCLVWDTESGQPQRSGGWRRMPAVGDHQDYLGPAIVHHRCHKCPLAASSVRTSLLGGKGQLSRSFRCGPDSLKDEEGISVWRESARTW